MPKGHELQLPLLMYRQLTLKRIIQRAGRITPAFSFDIRPDNRSWLGSGRFRKISSRPRQLDFSHIAAIWPDPDLAGKHAPPKRPA